MLTMMTKTTRIVMAAAMAFVFCIEGNAQFGGLLNSAKKKAKEKIEKKANDAVDNALGGTSVQETATNIATGQTGSSANVVKLYYSSGNPLGEWYPKTRQFKQMGKTSNGYAVSQTYTFKSDGNVVLEDGRCIGVIEADGTMNTVEMKNVKYDSQSGKVTWNNEWYGKMGDDNGMYVFNDKVAYSTDSMDRQIQTFILFNLIVDSDILTKYKQKYDEKVKFNEEQRQRQIANAKADMAASRTEGAPTKLRKGGSIVGEIRGNDHVWIGGSDRGKFENGNIWVGGSIAGKIEGNNIRKGGSIVGKVENGNVWIGGSIAGQIRPNGDVVKGGSIVGRAEGMRDARKVAVIYFFGFFNF